MAPAALFGILNGSQQPRNESGSMKQRQALLVAALAACCALPLHAVLRILSFVPCAPLPGTPPAMLGVVVPVGPRCILVVARS